ncbi:DUF4238 domain-containing protein [Clostridioides difficile]|uniref:DUF4238 domain-containing protein n=1 Tax=Clostridioides difficile TaxID=1496 RepID=UPI000D1DCAA8|nr:DUF4238 domain-containing protein [Clostridioides difficile]MBF9867508.1 DUF4238 domain-containing protein [Clostridioides difficile]MBY1216478.1 DUF4238 domain-containing protein [Clostridioides difficile]MBY1677478.1 DUF4238 domain-containing protein [Clostridioides difficile]MBZ1029639.1 DUF4238 domain-containing protein [Clostridioides difficile]MCA0852507.1 DUF4238 domain-containing protein [Clostridioides difficile]
MGENEKVYQHLIPKVYMKKWINSNDKIYIFEKNDVSNVDKKELDKKELDNFAGKKNYYTLFKGTPPYYYDMDKSVDKIEERDLIIENAWSKEQENKWNSLVKNIENNVLSAKKKHIKCFKKNEIIEFIHLMKYRGFKAESMFREVLKKSIKDENLFGEAIEKSGKYDENLKKFLSKYLLEYLDAESKYLPENEQLTHLLLLNEMRKFHSKEDNSYLRTELELYVDNITISFVVANENISFITSDNPSFLFDISEVRSNIKGTVNIMPITPKIVAIFLYCKDKDNLKKFKIEKVDDFFVKKVNNVIIKNSYEYIISKTDNIEAII